MLRLFDRINLIIKCLYPTRMTHMADTGLGMRGWVGAVYGRNLLLPHIKFIYPQAKKGPYTAWDGKITSIWFDRDHTVPDSPDNKESLDAACMEMVQIIKQNTKHDLNKLILGGFSMGGEMALQLGFRFLPEVAGIFALCSCLSNNSLVYTDLKSKRIPVFMYHGDQDEIIMYNWAENTYKKLASLGVDVEFHTLHGVGHALKKDGLQKLKNWIEKLIPPP